MATHVNKTSDIWVPELPVADFKAQIQHGDILFCAGQEQISKAIEDATQSPWSHVGYFIVDPWYPEPLFIEAVFEYGVRISRPYSMYIGCYDGDLVLCRRALPVSAQEEIVVNAVSHLGEGYDWQSEIQQAAHKVLGFLPEHATNDEIYCSGLVWEAASKTKYPIHRPNPNVMPSPEDIWTDGTVLPICKLLQGVK